MSGSPHVQARVLSDTGLLRFTTRERGGLAYCVEGVASACLNPHEAGQSFAVPRGLKHRLRSKMLRNIRQAASMRLRFLSLVLSAGLMACSGGQVGDYTIISDDALGQHKRTVEVSLPDRVTVAELTAIAKEIKSLDRGSYERTFISYELAGTPDDVGMAYAISHFRDDLEVNFMGLSRDEMNLVWSNIEKFEPLNISGDVVGRWINFGSSSSVTVIERDGDVYRSHEIYPKDYTNDLGWAPISDTYRVDVDDDSIRLMKSYAEGEWYRLYPDGELRFQSDLGSDLQLPKLDRPESR